MTEQELRALVRTTIARVRTGAPTAGQALSDPPDAAVGRVIVDPPGRHASHAIFAVASGAEQEGPCIIEPAVPCTHCGYCKSLGH